MAAALRAELEIAPKVDLDQLAEQLGLTIVEVDSESFEGALLRSSRKQSRTYSRAQRYPRDRPAALHDCS